MNDNLYQTAPMNVMPPVVGSLVWRGEPRSGISQSGNEWKSIDFAIGWNEGQYQRFAVFSLSGVDKVNAFLAYPPNGTLLEVKFSFDGHEYQGKYYGGLRAFSVRNIQQPAQQPSYAPQQGYQQQPMYQQQQFGGYQQQPTQQMPQQNAFAPQPQQPVYQQPIGTPINNQGGDDLPFR